MAFVSSVRLNLRSLLFIAIGMVLIAAAAVLMADAFGNPGTASAGVVSFACDRVCP